MDVQIKTTLKELITYLLFFVVLLIGNLLIFLLMLNMICLATLGMTTFWSKYNFYYTDSLSNLFRSQMEVMDDKMFWEYAQGELLDGMYSEEWYNKGTNM